MKKAFTLIELLIVFAVIGLFASIILINMKGTTYKAKVSKALQFSESVHNALGADAVGVWDFDEGSGTTARDGSGYGNNGTIYGAVYDCEDTPYHVVGSGKGKCALKFDGVDDYVEVPASPSLDVHYSMTVTAWVKWNADVQGPIFNWHHPGEGTWGTHVWRVYGKLFTRIVTRDGVFTSPLLIGEIPVGKWVFITSTYDYSSGYVRHYINGEFQGSLHIGSVEQSTQGEAYIGKVPWDERKVNGTIDGIRIYHTALSIGEIQKLYAEGAVRHQIAEK